MKNYFYKPSSFLKSASLSCLILASALQGNAQHQKLKVLFLGNGMTETNMLPIVLNTVVTSAGDTLVPEWNTPGGLSFREHVSDFNTIGKLSSGLWNYVVLQDDGRKPALSDADVISGVFPYADQLDSMVHKLNPCGRSVFFQTWGFKNGDPVNCPTFPPVCTYKGMDSLLEIRYQQMAIDNEALLAPVGLVFNKIRSAKPTLDLYMPDNENPSEAGTFAAAVTLYTILYRKDPTLITFNYTLNPIDATLIRGIVATNIFSSLPKYGVGKYDPDANFTSSVVGNVATFNSSATTNAVNYSWDFGDGGTSILASPSHTYAAAGTYNVRLVVDNCILFDTLKSTVEIKSTGGISENSILNSVRIYPNPAASYINIETQADLQNVTVSITNVVGSKVIGDQQYTNKAINIDGLSSGIYLINLKDNKTGENITRKFVKQ